MHRPHDLINDNVRILRQGVALIEALDQRLYSEANHPLLRYTVGGHIRHCIDFFNCFLSSVATRRINYDRRKRNEMVESDRMFAIAELENIIECLSRLPLTDGREEVEVILEDSSELDEASGWSRSSIARELQSLLSHTIHHYALIAIALRLQGFEPSAEFGVSLSTLQHWRASTNLLAQSA